MKRILSLLIPFLIGLPALATAAVVFPNGSSWNYLLGTAEASSPTDAWRAIVFNDAAWTPRPSPVGYGQGIINPLPTSAVGGYTTVYLRKAFTIGDASTVGQLELNLSVDDGVVVWLNGMEIGRTNVPAGQLAFNAAALSAPSLYYTYSITLNASTTPAVGGVLQSGTNLLAIHLLNANTNSSDIYLDAALDITAVDTAPPVVQGASPVQGGTVNDLTQVTVTFSEPVAGVNAADLLVNGVPATGLSGAGAVYTFSFPQPAGGAVNLTWAVSHGIADLAIPANPFDRTAPGNTWSYTLDDIFPPTVVSASPQIGSTLISLSQITVSFSEPVTGVDAADLTINGTPAASVTPQSASQYVFGFPQPANGSVSVVWAGGHGIQDLGAPPNPFAGGSWSYTLDTNATIATLVISEFMASNTRTLADEDNEFSDWVEIHNYGPAPVSLLGWSLTDNAGNLTKWQFPDTNINAGAYMVIFASEKNRRVPGARLHTNFKLSGSGEYLGLVRQGTNIVSQYAPVFPPQIADLSYGLSQTLAETVVVASNGPVRVYVPTNDLLGLTWTAPGFNDSTWLFGQNGVGFETVPAEPGESPYGSLIATDILTPMRNVNATAYLRLPFTVTDPTQVSSLSLAARYDDGLVAYLNGAVVASRNAPALTYNAAATATRSNVLGREFENIELSNAAQWLTTGTNVLAIHGLNAHATNADFLVQATLTVRQTLSFAQGSPRYFSLPTPGGPNGVGTVNLGPILSAVTHAPLQPLDNDLLFVTARITPSFAPVASNVLVYRVMFGAEVTVPMLDNGANGDGAAGDGVFGAVIPASASTNNQMVRWYISSVDSLSRTSRWPFYNDPLNSPQYLGTVVKDPNLTNPLPVLHWFLPTATAADSDAGSRASLYFLGQFYDNVYMNLHGQSTRGFPKKSYDVSFNSGYKFTYRAGAAPVSDVNWLTTYADKAHMRNALAHEAFAALGNAHHWVEPVRVQQNSTFYGTAHLVENGEADFIERLGLNPENPLYKVYNTFTVSPTHANLAAQNVEKKSRKFEGSADLQALLTGILQTGEARRAFMYDNVDLPQMINSMVIRALIGEQDCCHKNYYFYRDTLGDREWEIWPWDVDLSYGRRWIGANTYWDDQMIIDTTMPVGNNNGLLTALYNTPEMREMYWRRMRTLMDEFLQAPGTPTNQLRIERRIEEWVAKVTPDAAADLAKWGTWCCGQMGPFTPATIPIATNYQTIRQAADLMKFGYLPQRRTYLFTNRVASAGLGGEIPNVQPADARIFIASFEANPVSGNQAEEYLVLTNMNNYAVDVSGWKLSGAIDFTFKPGTVIPSGRLLYVTPDVIAFRARATGPRGGQSLLAVGGYSGQLSARGETIRLANAAGALVDKWAYPANPGAVQQFLRITEIMYNPAPMTGNTNSNDEFEYIELRNTSPAPLSLANVRFDQGISFNFTGSAVTTLAPGAAVLVVKNAAQFALRYPSVSGAAIAGQYTGSLDNGGERIRLIDGGGEEILDFEYKDSWYPLTDGFGFSLVVVDEEAQPDAWGNKSQWRASGALDGSPSLVEPPVSLFPPVLITEVLTRTEVPPPFDTIELHNPTGSNVNVGGWFLTDNFALPKKFRIADNTMIAPGGYLLFDESQFNAGGTNFSLSSEGEEVYLFSANVASNLTGYVHGFNFGAADNGVSFGRHITSDGRELFVAQTARTFPGANAGPRVGPLVITEIMYRPIDLQTQTGFFLPEPADNSVDEFVEIRNIEATNVPLALGANAWRLTGGMDYLFPLGVSLNPGEFALLVNFSPADTTALAAFRMKYGVAPTVQIFGPYSGKLNNSGDDVELKRPTLLAGVTLAYVMVDKVDYKDAAPWPAGADGLGFSLQRWSATDFGNDPANWVAAAPTAASGTVTNAVPPSFASHPQSRTVAAGALTTLIASVNGSGPLAYQWLFNDTSIAGATNASLQISPATLAREGDYTLLAYNQAGLAVSEPATVTIIVPPSLTQSPTNILVRVPPDGQAAPTTNVTFTVGAFSRSALTYQWKFNDTNIPGATAPSLTITNVTTNSLGYVSAMLSDGVSSLTTTSAWLYPLVNIQAVLAPRPQDVVVGETVTLSSEFSGWPPPYTVEWQLGSVGQKTNVQNGTSSFFNFTAPSITATQTYRAIVRNLATPGGRLLGNARIVTLADGDGDGIPDAWENAFFGGNTIADPSGDDDGDGFLNWQEYVAGTIPTNALSYLKVDQLTPPAGAIVQFQAVSNRTYTVQYRDAMGPGTWNNLADVGAHGTNRVATIPDPGSTTNRFYRLVTPRQQ
jgi:CotH kinase protein/Lamin Tail Domain